MSSWGGVSLGEIVFKLVSQGKQDTKEFQDLLKYFGRKKLLELYLAERKKLSDKVSSYNKARGIHEKENDFDASFDE